MSPRTIPPVPSARRAALECLSLALDKGVDVQSGLNQVLSQRDLSPRDAALATELSYGYLRYKGRIRYVLSRYLNKPDKLPPRLFRAMGVAAFEIMFLDRVPNYASVDWAVSLAKQTFNLSMSRLANAVLRKVSSAGESLSEPDFYRDDDPDTMTFYSRYYSCPYWLAGLWLASYGPENAARYLAATLQAPPLGLRVNRTRPEYEEVFSRLSASPACVAAREPGVALGPGFKEPLDDLLERGVVSRQSMASQEALALLEPGTWKTPVWDACAGRGGKTAYLLEQGVTDLYASDVHSSRLALLNKETARLGLDPARVFLADASKPPPLREKPGTILLDAPCSGLGVLSRRPDIKWKRTPKDLDDLHSLQRAILENAYSILPSGGSIAYITCTLNPAENQELISSFIEAHWDIRLDRSQTFRPSSPLREFFFIALVKKA